MKITSMNHQSSVTKTPFTYLISLRRLLFSLHVELTSSFSFVLQESVPSLNHERCHLPVLDGIGKPLKLLKSPN